MNHHEDNRMASTTRTIGNVLGGIFRAISNLTRGVADAFDTVVDFAAVRVFGLPFIVLGYRQTGKTTLLEWLRSDLLSDEDFQPDPTAAGGDPVPAFVADIAPNGSGMKLKPKRDVGGEYSMWETDWVDLFQQSKPRGIVFMIDHTNPYQHKDAFNFVLQMLDDEESTRRHLHTFLLLINKSDLWEEEDLDYEAILDLYRNEVRRLKSQADRLHYEYHIAASSLVDGPGPRDVMTSFFDAIRPKPVGE